MPNHVLNELHIGAPLSAVAPLALNEDGQIDFEVLLPVPLNFWMGNVGADHTKTFPGTALDWCSKNWSTKWGAYGLDQGGKYKSVLAREAGETVLTFQTAWSPPMGWVVALFNRLKCPVALTWLDEGREHAFFDRFWMVGDHPEWERKQAPDDETERMAVLYWGAEAWASIKAERAEDEP